LICSSVGIMILINNSHKKRLCIARRKQHQHESCESIDPIRKYTPGTSFFPTIKITTRQPPSEPQITPVLFYMQIAQYCWIDQ
jgi:hypothetical protein